MQLLVLLDALTAFFFRGPDDDDDDDNDEIEGERFLLLRATRPRGAVSGPAEAPESLQALSFLPTLLLLLLENELLATLCNSL